MLFLLQYVGIFSFFALPVGAICFFVLSLIRFIKGKRALRNAPDSISPEAMGKRKLCLILSIVILGVLLAVFIGLCALVFIGIAYM